MRSRSSLSSWVEGLDSMCPLCLSGVKCGSRTRWLLARCSLEISSRGARHGWSFAAHCSCLSSSMLGVGEGRRGATIYPTLFPCYASDGGVSRLSLPEYPRGRQQ